MGRITVFCADRCPHSRRISKLFRNYGLPCVEINITRHPEKLEDMIALSGNFATPQVFFNTRHVGGAAETAKLLKKWGKKPSAANSNGSSDSGSLSKRTILLERYMNEIERYPDPSNPRFSLPTEAPTRVLESAPCRGKCQYSIRLPCGSKTTVVKVTETLKRILPANKDKSKGMIVYKNAFTGAEALEAVMTHYTLSKDEAIEFGCHLLEEQVIRSLTSTTAQHDEHSIKFSFDLYRLQCHDTPQVLNSYRVWTEPVPDPDCMRLLDCLTSQLADIVYTVADDEGMIDYKAAHHCPVWPEFEEAVCALQKVDMFELDEQTKKAFGMNVYNLMIKYAFMKVGIGQNAASRTAFFNGVKFNVGGEEFSFQEWEHGMLRGNRRAPYTLRPCFSRKDSRLPLALRDLDYRLHFALNCGARSCPPINNYSVRNLDQELKLASQSFCNDDDNVLILPDKREVHLSMIFYWYRSDFVEKCSNDDLIVILLDHLHGDKQRALASMTCSMEPIKFVKLHYDWSPFAKDFEPFHPKNIQAERRSIKALSRVRAIARQIDDCKGDEDNDRDSAPTATASTTSASTPSTCDMDIVAVQ